MNVKYTLGISAILVLLVYLGACGSSDAKDASGNETASASALAAGEKVYERYCLLCHGADGKLAVNGAKDITISQLTLAERVTLIRQGKTLMTPFEGVLSEAEIQAVAEYTMTMK